MAKAQFDVLEWMAQHGHPGYKNRVEYLRKVGSMFVEDGEPIPPGVQEKIQTTISEAQDRFDDWASDRDD